MSRSHLTIVWSDDATRRAPKAPRASLHADLNLPQIAPITDEDLDRARRILAPVFAAADQRAADRAAGAVVLDTARNRRTLRLS